MTHRRGARLARILAAAACAAPLIAGDAPREWLDVPLARGARLLAMRTPGAELVRARLGFLAPDEDGIAALHAAALEARLREAFATSGAAPAPKVSVERDDAALVVELAVAGDAFEAALGRAVETLAGATFEEADAEARPSDAPALPLGVDFGGRLRTLDSGEEALLLRALDVVDRMQSAGTDAPGGAAEEPLAARLAAYHARTVAVGRLVVAVEGDLATDRSKEVVEAALGALGASDAPPAAPGATLAIPLAREVWTALDPELDRSALVAVAGGPRADSPDRAAWAMLEAWLALRIPPDAGVAVWPGFGRSGRFVAWTTSRPGDLGARGSALLASLAGGEPISDTTLGIVRQGALEALGTGAGGDRLAREHRLALRGAPPGFTAALAREIEATDAAALARAAERYLAADRFVLAAVTTPDAANALDSLGRVVVPEAREAARERAEASAIQERTSRELARLFEAAGGRELWQAARAVTITADVTRGGRTVRAVQDLDLTEPRFVLSVEGGGTTVLDRDGARWFGPGGPRALDAAALEADARASLLSLMHRLSLAPADLADPSFTVTAGEGGLLVRDPSGFAGRLELDAAGLPSRFEREAPRAAAWRFEAFATFGGLAAPARVVDETNGVTFELRSVTFAPRYEPPSLR